MSLKPGYKQTDVDVIPDDWKEVRLGEIAEIISGGTPSTAIGSYWGGDIPWCTPTDITSCRSNYLFDTERKITPAGLAGSAASLLPPGSLLLCTRATVGDVRIAGRAIATNQGFKSLVVNSQANSKFVFFVLQTLKQAMIEKSSGSTFLELGKNDLSNIVVLMPPLKEQEAIAEALSDVDALVYSLEALLTKKRNMKTGVMQELLTGRTRLPGFTGDWKEVRLGDLLGYEQPTKYLVSSSDYVEGGQVPVLTAGKSFFLGYTGDTAGIYTNLPTIIFDDFTTATQWVDFEFKVKSSACKMLRPKNGSCNPRYVFERLRALNYQTSDHKRHWISVFHSMEMLMPPLKEQEAIAAVLSDMDDEIEALEKRLVKTRDLKQGMAQELLTGRTRLV